MSTTYAQKQTPAQKNDAPNAASILDSSSQSESLQRKADMANNATQRAEAPRPNNTGMPDNLKAGIESLSGFSMDNVRVHYNSSKPATVQALAYTQGTDIHVAPGQEKHLPHEAWHVAQQMAGRVSPTTNINGMPVNDNAALEHEADVMGEKAVSNNCCLCASETCDSVKNDSCLRDSTVQRVGIGVNGQIYLKHGGGENDSSGFGTDVFTKTMINALDGIKCENYVKKILNAYYLNEKHVPDKGADCNKCRMSDAGEMNWGDISINAGYECAFEGGNADEKINSPNISIMMNVKQCENMFFGNTADLKKVTSGNQTVGSTLLHELGHAYQHYLKLKNKSVKFDKSDVLNGFPEALKEYPLLFELIYTVKKGNPVESQTALNEIQNTLAVYFENSAEYIALNKNDPTQIGMVNEECLEKIKSLSEIIKGGISKENVNSDFANKLIALMNYIGHGATYEADDGDNVLFNEFAYNYKKDEIGVRGQYLSAVDLNRNKLFNGVVKFTGHDINYVEECNFTFKSLVEIKKLAEGTDLFLNPVLSTFWIKYVKRTKKFADEGNDDAKKLLDMFDKHPYYAILKLYM